MSTFEPDCVTMTLLARLHAMLGAAIRRVDERYWPSLCEEHAPVDVRDGDFIVSTCPHCRTSIRWKPGHTPGAVPTPEEIERQRIEPREKPMRKFALIGGGLRARYEDSMPRGDLLDIEPGPKPGGVA